VVTQSTATGEQEKQKSYQLDIDRILSESRRGWRCCIRDAEDRVNRESLNKLALARGSTGNCLASYGAGLITNSDYLDAELEIQSIETQSLQDRYSMIMNQLELKKELSYFLNSGSCCGRFHFHVSDQSKRSTESSVRSRFQKQIPDYLR
jgi:hypothetical protein